MAGPGNRELFERIRFQGDPVADPGAIVVAGRARFTVLTPRLLRLEWSETGMFEDRATYAFPTRRAPVPRFSTREEDGALVIDTGALVLRYRRGDGPFTAANLSISFELGGETRTWAPGMADPHNLRGTRRTLDTCAGDAALEEGLFSRAGWALFDDSASVVFDDDGWVAARPDHALQDWVFFGFGHDYRGGLAEYARFGGSIPLVPRYMLGAWWSRYWEYSEDDLKDLVRDFERHELPLDVLVVDMDWHTPDSWTGYTWNRELFPDPPAFLRWVHEQGLRVTLNLHPAGGVQSFEEVYPRFARAMGVDPAEGEPIPFRIADPRFVRLYFELLHHPMEDDGVDFWWMDWQQGESSEVRGLDPLPWINHLHFSDSARRGSRPTLYSRWGGVGNHRYPIGFSGDTYAVWPSLRFQPYFTATASNVLFGWWSHDIGGHMGGATEPELFARWVQFGALSPCLRLHATKDPRAERRPWAFPDEVYRAAKGAFHLRYRLVPYLYTMARVAHDTGVSLCRPTYYEHPEEEAAYVARNQYFLGDQAIAAPIVHPADPETGLARTDVWLPEGSWIDWQTKELFTGPRWVRLVGDVQRVPLLVRAGGILPLAPPARRTDGITGDELILSVFPGDGSFRLYEDDGVTGAYREGAYEWTTITSRVEDGETWVVEVAPVEGFCDALPRRRSLEIRLEGCALPDRVTVDGAEAAGWSYDAAEMVTVIRVEAHGRKELLAVAATAAGTISALGDARNRELALAEVRRLLGQACPDDAGDLDAVLRVDAPGRADAVARLGGPFVGVFEYVTPEEAALRLGRVVVAAPAAGGPFDAEIAFTLFRGEEVEEHVVRREGATEDLIVATPFGFVGRPQAAFWEAEVRITWRGRTLPYIFRSTLLFPTIHAWRGVFYSAEETALDPAQVIDAEGRINPDLDWRDYGQHLERVHSLAQPHALPFSWMAEFSGRLEAGEPLRGYLATTVCNPCEQEAVIVFLSGGRTDVYVNGQKVEELPAEKAKKQGVSLLSRQARRTVAVRLREGRNRLLVYTEPPQPEGDWHLVAALRTPDGAPMIELALDQD
jgi:alpha-glucosidase